MVRTKRKPPQQKQQASLEELQAELTRAQTALDEAEHQFNLGLANPKADLSKLENAVRRAELAISNAGARLAGAMASR